MLIEPEQLYETHREASAYLLDKLLPPWAELSWPQRDKWQEQADELNEARREDA